MGKIQTFRDLMVWQKSMVLVKQVYAVTKVFPRDEMYGLTNQIRRGAVSIPSNIAEGYGRNSTVDYIRFLRIASGSVYELQTQAEIAVNLNYIKPEDFEQLNATATEIAKMLSSMIGKLSKRQQDSGSRQ
ncbi:MAG: four helix bundle protein [Planctomycetota bacterium]|jgi:four helix bundle protein